MPAAPDRAGFVERVMITLSGARQPIVAILLAISFFTVISGKPVDGLLLFVVATALAWDAGMRAREQAACEAARAYRAGLAGTVPHDAPAASPWPDGADQPAGAPADQAAGPSAWRLRTTRPGLRVLALGSAAAMIYALVVGSFDRYSWPATAGVVGLGAGVVIVGWGGPTRQREIPARFSRTAVIPWTSLLVVGGLWELAALLGQPNIETGSYAHPTISTLTDPLLSSTPGRAFALLAWIALGFFLVER